MALFWLPSHLLTNTIKAGAPMCSAKNVNQFGDRLHLLTTPWSWGCVAAVDSCGRTIFVGDAHRDDGKRFVVRADEKLTAFVELESAIRTCCKLSRQADEVLRKNEAYKHS
jgi:hypothetical protein